eukprot:2327136-Rhodomonas_salina.2
MSGKAERSKLQSSCRQYLVPELHDDRFPPNPFISAGVPHLGQLESVLQFSQVAMDVANGHESVGLREHQRAGTFVFLVRFQGSN